MERFIAILLSIPGILLWSCQSIAILSLRRNNENYAKKGFSPETRNLHDVDNSAETIGKKNT
jgi:hypothetical protein